jgi:four helix bundle protein
MASGSLYELETQLLLSTDFGYSSKESLDASFVLITALQKMLFKFQEQLVVKTK